MQFSRDVGAARAASNIHPAESLRAATLLFETTLSAVAEIVPPADARTILPELAVAINNSVFYRIREGATAYASFLLQQIHEANLGERRRIAREMHDRVGHAAAVAQRHLELHELYLQRSSADAARSLADASQALRETVDTIRAVTTDLHLSEPLEGLEQALLGYAESVTETTILVDVNGDESWAPPDVLEETFLVVREALRNAVSHGQAGKADVTIDIAPHELRATIDDDGVGFEPGGVTSEPLGVGLASMRERAELLGGSVSVSSHVGWGSHVEMNVPLSGRRNDL
jgi:signal transduction histidine kinase